MWAHFPTIENPGGDSLVVQWLELHPFTVGGMGSTPGQGTEISQASWHGQK